MNRKPFSAVLMASKGFVTRYRNRLMTSDSIPIGIYSLFAVSKSKIQFRKEEADICNNLQNRNFINNSCENCADRIYKFIAESEV